MLLLRADLSLPDQGGQTNVPSKATPIEKFPPSWGAEANNIIDVVAKHSLRERTFNAMPSSSSAPASEVIAPPSKAATTARPLNPVNSSAAALHSVGIG
jgi:hypothetical protein